MALCCYRVTDKGNYTEKDAAYIIRQILKGVQYLHAHGEALTSAQNYQSLTLAALQ